MIHGARPSSAPCPPLSHRTLPGIKTRISERCFFPSPKGGACLAQGPQEGDPHPMLESLDVSSNPVCPRRSGGCWLRSVGRCHPHGRPCWNSGLLAPAWHSPRCCSHLRGAVSQQMEDLSVSLVSEMKINKQQFQILPHRSLGTLSFWVLGESELASPPFMTNPISNMKQKQ